ncbi:MAG: DinB family protein [Chloroflexi bacterium]|nr:DinB family protein [Chloroflexota bacterium]
MTQRAVLLQALASTPRDINGLIRALPANGYDWRPDDGWSVGQVLDHLLAVEAVYRARLERIRREDNPRLPHFDSEEMPPTPTPPPLDVLLKDFAEKRRGTLDFLTDLGPGEWQRPASRNSRGATTLRWQVVEMMNHDLAHLGQLVDIRVQWDRVKRDA